MFYLLYKLCLTEMPYNGNPESSKHAKKPIRGSRICHQVFEIQEAGLNNNIDSFSMANGPIKCLNSLVRKPIAVILVT